MHAGELSPSVDTLVSAAAEGALIAGDVAEDRTKATYVRAHVRELAEEVEHEAEKLNDANAVPEVEAGKEEALTLAEDISTALGQLQTAPTDMAEARNTRRDLEDLAKKAEDLAASL
jgi:hypothetical protein